MVTLEIICEVNEDKDKIRENIKTNVQLGLPQVRPYETQWEVSVNLVCGGPSLNDDKVYQHLLDNIYLSKTSDRYNIF